MYHTAAFFASLGSVTDSNLAALADRFLAPSNNRFILFDTWQLVWAAAFGTTLDRVRLNSPTVNIPTQSFIRPIQQVAVPATDPNVADYRLAPFLLRPNEEFGLDATTNAAGPANTTVVVGLMDRPQPISPGRIWTLRGTSTVAAVANAWTNLATITWANTLSGGWYEIVGLEVQSANAIAARVVIPGQAYFPGALSITGLGNRSHAMFSKGGLGVWGRFQAINIPTIDVLCNAADAAHVIYMDIKQVSA